MVKCKVKRLIERCLVVVALLGLISCSQEGEVKVAFLSDIHFLDLYGGFSDIEYSGVKNPKTGEYTIARTMESQLGSTRLFNENYFALLAALDDIAARGVKIIILPGDMTDDGQYFNVRGLKKVLDRYSEKYGIQFLATTGNHDPNRPYRVDAGKRDFLGSGGKRQPIMSREGLYSSKSGEHDVIITEDVAVMGYEGVINTLSSCGFYPQKEYLYWETPFSKYEYKDYSYSRGLKSSNIDQRIYPLPPYNNLVPDVSYLVEPIEGVWFLAIDANVYLPKEGAKENPLDPSNYKGSGDGYKDVLTHKRHLVKWVESVVKRAERLNKKLITFSHYPMVNFHDNASDAIEHLVGGGKVQLHRVPSSHVSEVFADAGVKLHFAGHMHINDTGIYTSKGGNRLVNIQVPSLGAYIPAYKLLTINESNSVEIETIVINEVPRFDELFPLYLEEHKALVKSGSKEVWDSEILSAKNYREYTMLHLKGLVKSRFKRDWPEAINEDQLFDLFRLLCADQLAIGDIGEAKIDEYRKMITEVNSRTEDSELKEFLNIFNAMLNGDPADKLVVNIE